MVCLVQLGGIFCFLFFVLGLILSLFLIISFFTKFHQADLLFLIFFDAALTEGGNFEGIIELASEILRKEIREQANDFSGICFQIFKCLHGFFKIFLGKHVEGQKSLNRSLLFILGKRGTVCF